MNRFFPVFLFFSLLLFPSFTENKQVFEMMDESLRPLVERVKWNYDQGIDWTELYKMADNLYVVSFAIVASCQEDTLQKRLSHERALSQACDFVFYKFVFINSQSLFSVYDVDAEFDPDAPPVDGGDDFIIFPSEPEIFDLSKDDYCYDLTERSLLTLHLNEGMCPLMKFSGEKGEMVYAYYYILPPKNSLKEEKNSMKNSLKKI